MPAGGTGPGGHMVCTASHVISAGLPPEVSVTG
jgi:hypothetical protein